MIFIQQCHHGHLVSPKGSKLLFFKRTLHQLFYFNWKHSILKKTTIEIFSKLLLQSIYIKKQNWKNCFFVFFYIFILYKTTIQYTYTIVFFFLYSVLSHALYKYIWFMDNSSDKTFFDSLNLRDTHPSDFFNIHRILSISRAFQNITQN